MQTQDPIAIVKNVVEAMNHREMTEVMDYFDDDATLRLEPALPGTALEAYSGKERIQTLLQGLLAEHWDANARQCRTVDGGAACEVTISADRFSELGVEPVQARVQAVLDGNLIQTLTFTFDQDSVHRVTRASRPSKR